MGPCRLLKTIFAQFLGKYRVVSALFGKIERLTFTGTFDAFQHLVKSHSFKQICFPHRSEMGVLKSFLGNGSHHDARLQRSVSSLVVAPPASGYRPEIVTSVKNASQQFPHNPRMSNQRVFFYPISPSGSAAASTRQRFCDVKPSSPPHQTTAPEDPQARGQALARLSPRARRHGRNPRGTPPLKRPRKHRIN